MIDLSAIPAALLENRGSYSTVRSAHEEEKQNLQKLCGQLATYANQVLRRMQPDNGEVPTSVADLLKAARVTVDAMEMCVERIESLAKQRAALKPLAWPSK